MRHFLFRDSEGSGEFTVKAENYPDALEFAELFFRNPKYLYELDEEGKTKGLGGH